jgi:TonB family protein
VSYEDADFVAPAAGDPDGDEDWTFDSASPSTLAGRGGGSAGTGTVPAQTIEKPIAPLEAAYLCTYQSLRGLPRALYRRGHAYKLVVKMCISAEGRVERVTLEQGAAAELDARVVEDMHAWRYKPRIVRGKPTAFCYKVNVTYDVD